METISYMNPAISKADWPQGEWHHEPDKKQWQDEVTAYPCLIVRNDLGALCGYVGVYSNHPLYGKDYDTPDINIHGGLTFASKCQESANEARGICHKAPLGQDDVWWFGFDCAHAGDLIPSWQMYGLGMLCGDAYRNFEYVTNEVADLAKQLKALE